MGKSQKRKKGIKPIKSIEQVRELRSLEEDSDGHVLNERVRLALQSARVSDQEATAVEAYLLQLKPTLLAQTAPTTPTKRGRRSRPSAEASGWTAPADVQLIGSFLSRAVCKLAASKAHRRAATAADPSVDVAVKIPSSYFDHEAIRRDAFAYHRQRDAYMQQLAEHLAASAQDVGSAQLLRSARTGCAYVQLSPPALQLRSNGAKLLDAGSSSSSSSSSSSVQRAASKNWNVRLVPWVDEQLFGGDIDELQRQRTDAGLEPLPDFYYAALREDVMHAQHITRLHSVLKKAESLRDALILLKLWWSRRRLNVLLGCPSQWNDEAVSGFFFASLLLHLHDKKKLSAAMTALQCFRGVLDYLASNGGELLPDDGTAAPVLRDPSGSANLTYSLSRSLYNYVLLAARQTLARFADFDYIFALDWSHVEAFDECGVVSVSGAAHRFDPQRRSGNELLANRVLSTLQRGLGDRAQLLLVFEQAGRDDDSDGGRKLFVGYRLNGERASKMVVMGPAADDVVEGRSFRDYWGSMAEVRRFRDGAINLCAVWESSADKTHTITGCIADFVLRRHALADNDGDQAVQYTHVAAQLDGQLLSQEANTSGTINGFFERLCSHLLDLDSLPLSISSVYPACSIASSTDVAPPLPNVYATSGAKSAAHKRQRTSDATEVVCVKPFEAVIELESSIKWPSDATAIERVIAAFYVEISAQLAAVCGVQSTAWETHLDVYLAGFVFRFFIVHRPLLSLLKASNRARAKQLRALYVQRCEHVAFVGLFSGKFAAFSRVCHLAKTWVHSHMFSDLLPEDVVELLVCALFCHHVADAPQSHLSGFLRFLRLLAKYNWRVQPLLVYPDHEPPTADEQHAAVKGMDDVPEAQRPPMYIVASYHRKAAIDMPLLTPQLFLSLQALAAQALAAFDGRLLQDSLSLDILYAPSLSDFDLLIVLNQAAAPGKSISATTRAALFDVGRYQNLAISSSKNNLLVGFDAPGHYVELLRERFGHLALFFFNHHRCDLVAAVWKPDAFLPRPFHPTAATLTVPFPDQSFVLPNIIEVIAEMQLMGGKLVKKIVVR